MEDNKKLMFTEHGDAPKYKGFELIRVDEEYGFNTVSKTYTYRCKTCGEITTRPQCHEWHTPYKKPAWEINEPGWKYLAAALTDFSKTRTQIEHPRPELFSEVENKLGYFSVEEYIAKCYHSANLNPKIKMNNTTKNSAKVDAKIKRGVELQNVIQRKREEKKRVELMLAEGNTTVDFRNRRLEAAIGSCSLPQEGVNHLLGEVVKGLEVTIKELEKEYENL